MKKISLTNSPQKVLVDDEDYKWLSAWKWCTDTNPINRNNYALRTSGGTVSMHRLIMGQPKGMEVDHINHDTLDNRKENLRVVTTAQNQRNLKKKDPNYMK